MPKVVDSSSTICSPSVRVARHVYRYGSSGPQRCGSGTQSRCRAVRASPGTVVTGASAPATNVPSEPSTSRRSTASDAVIDWFRTRR